MADHNVTRMTEAVRGYLAGGFSVIPISRHKKPYFEGYQEYSYVCPDAEQWAQWQQEYRDCNVAAVLGGCITEPGDQLVDVEADDPETEALLQEWGLPVTPTWHSARGCHRLFLAPAGLHAFHPKSEERALHLPEVRADTDLSILPPSVHDSGAVYRWAPGLALGRAEIAQLPEWGLQIMRREHDLQLQARGERRAKPRARSKGLSYAAAALTYEVEDLACTPEGARNQTLNNAAFKMGSLIAAGALDADEVRAKLLEACEANGLLAEDGQHACERTIMGGINAGKKRPRPAPEPRRQGPHLDDAALAEYDRQFGRAPAAEVGDTPLATSSPGADPETGEVPPARDDSRPIAECDARALFDLALPDSGWLRTYHDCYKPCTEAPPVFHLACGLACLSSAVGRRAWLPWAPYRLYPNLFVALIGGQGLVRKSTALAFADQVVTRAFEQQVYSGDATAEALVSSVLADSPERLLLYDELARAIGGPDYLAGIKPLFAELYNCPDSLSRERVGKGSGSVEAPAVSILGASTMAWLRGAVKGGDVGGGLLSRFLWIVGEADGTMLPLPPSPDQGTVRDLATRLALLRSALGDDGRELDPEPMRGDYTRLYSEYHRLATREDEEGLGGFLSRLVSTHVPKLMMLYTLAEDPHATAVGEHHLFRVEALTELLRRGLYQVVERVAESAADQLRERVFGLIKRNEPMPHGKCLKQSHSEARLFDEAIRTLIEAERIAEGPKGPRGGVTYIVRS